MDIYKLVSKHKRGDITLAPFASVSIFPGSSLISTLDYQSHEKEMAAALKKKGIEFNTLQVLSPGVIQKSVGAIESLSISMNFLYGAEFSMKVYDLEAGRQMLRFLKLIQSKGTVYSTYCRVRLGWISSNNDKIQSPDIYFMIDQISTSYEGGQFFYTIHGVNLVTPYFTKQILNEGKFKGTVGNCLDEWERVTGITIKNKELVDLETTIDTKDNLLQFDNDSPQQMLNRILSYATPKNKEAKDQRVSYMMDPNGRVVYLQIFSQKAGKVYKKFVIGSPESTVIDINMDDDLAFTRFTSMVTHTMNTDKMEIHKTGTEDNKSKTATTHSPRTNFVNGNKSPNTINDPNKTILSEFDTRTGSITILGDPYLIPTESSPLMKQFYTPDVPFLGVGLRVYQPVPSNLGLETTQLISSTHWLNGIYRVKSITHSITGSDYQTSMDVIGDILNKELF